MWLSIDGLPAITVFAMDVLIGLIGEDFIDVHEYKYKESNIVVYMYKNLTRKKMSDNLDEK